MRFLAGFLTALVFVVLFRVPIRKVPFIFYLLAILLDVLLLTKSYIGLPAWLYTYFLSLFQSNTFAMGLITVIMFIGVFKEQSTLRRLFVPIRGELSIIAAIVCVGHIVRYGAFYLGQVFSATSLVPDFRFWATLFALLPVLLLIPLTVTSVRLIRAKMEPRKWRYLQRLAYPFYGLVYVHILFYLLSPAISGNSSARVSLCAYLVIGLSYTVLRIRLFLSTRNNPIADIVTARI